MRLRIPVLLAAVAAAWSIAPAWSQQEEQRPPADRGAPAQEAMPGNTAVQLDDRKIEQFADAYVAVQSIQQKAAAELQTTQDPQQAAEVKSKAENQMVAAVERTGLKVDEFNQIVETMASNTDVRSRVAAKLQQRAPTHN